MALNDTDADADDYALSLTKDEIASEQRLEELDAEEYARVLTEEEIANARRVALLNAAAMLRAAFEEPGGWVIDHPETEEGVETVLSEFRALVADLETRADAEPQPAADSVYETAHRCDRRK